MDITKQQLVDFSVAKHQFSVDNYGMTNTVDCLATVLFGLVEELGELHDELAARLQLRNNPVASRVQAEWDNNSKDILGELGDCFAYFGIATQLLQFGDDKFQYLIDSSRAEANDSRIYGKLQLGVYDQTELELFLVRIRTHVFEGLGVFKRVMRGDAGSIDRTVSWFRTTLIILEITVNHMGVTFDYIWESNDKKLGDRKSRGALKGTGSKR